MGCTDQGQVQITCAGPAGTIAYVRALGHLFGWRYPEVQVAEYSDLDTGEAIYNDPLVQVYALTNAATDWRPPAQIALDPGPQQPQRAAAGPASSNGKCDNCVAGCAEIPSGTDGAASSCSSDGSYASSDSSAGQPQPPGTQAVHEKPATACAQLCASDNTDDSSDEVLTRCPR